MAAKKKLADKLYVGFTVSVAVLCYAKFGLDIFTIETAFHWFLAFINMFGMSTDTHWSAAIFALSILNLFNDATVILYIQRSWQQRSNVLILHILVLLILSSIWQIAIAAPIMVIIREHNWAEILRVAGSPKLALGVDVLHAVELATVIFWSAIGGTCTIIVLTFLGAVLITARRMHRRRAPANTAADSAIEMIPQTEPEPDQARSTALAEDTPGSPSQHELSAEGIRMTRDQIVNEEIPRMS